MIKFGEVKINQKSRDHILHCLDTHNVTMGERTKQLENEWSNLFGHKHTIAVSSGTTACTSLCMSLYELGAKPGDEVIIPALSFIATANAVRAAGLTPVFVDVKRETLNINPDLIKVTPKTRAIMAVNLMGKPFDVERIKNIADENDLFLFGDCCESHGCRYKNKFMEEYCDATAYSCYAAHILFGCEEGLVCTNDDTIADLIRSIRSHGRKPGTLYFDHGIFGLNFKPSDLHSSIALGNIGEFWDIFNKRYDNVERLKEGLSHLRETCYFSEEDEDYINSPHGFSITLKEKDETKFQELKNKLEGIEWKRNFGCMATQHRAFSYLGHELGEFPEAEHVGDFGLHIGVHQYLTDKEIQQIIRSLA